MRAAAPRVVNSEGNLVRVGKGRRGRCCPSRQPGDSQVRSLGSLSYESPAAASAAGSRATIAINGQGIDCNSHAAFLTSAVAARLKATQRTNCATAPRLSTEALSSTTQCSKQHGCAPSSYPPAAGGRGPRHGRGAHEAIKGARLGDGRLGRPRGGGRRGVRGARVRLGPFGAAAARARPRRGALPRGGRAHGRGRAARPGRRGEH